MDSHQEVERKFDLAPDQEVPDLARGPVAVVGEPVVTELVATYFDTAHLALAAAGITLRRRTGGSDAGWHLKLPKVGDARVELHRPLGRGTRTVPKQLLDQVRAVVRDHALAPVAGLRTTRVERHLFDADGMDLAVVADDTVEAERLTGDGEQLRWRELEVELVAGDDSALEAVAATLAAGGVAPSASSSKLARVLGNNLADRADRTSASRRTADGSVGAHVKRLVAEQVGELLSHDAGARTGNEEPVHDLCVAAWRLRSILATYRSVLDRTATDRVRDELRWLGTEGGAARDADVQHARLLARLEVVPSDLVLGPVRRRAQLEMQVRIRTGLGRLRAALDSTRYYRLLDDLDALAVALPLTKAAREPVGHVLPRAVGRQVRHVLRAADAVAGAGPAGADADRGLHQLRKAARGARYAAESAAPVLGRRARRLAGRMEDLQELLGEHQDAVTARSLYLELGAAAHEAGENAFTFGVLQAEEDAVARAAAARHPEVLRRAVSAKSAGWVTGTGDGQEATSKRRERRRTARS